MRQRNRSPVFCGRVQDRLIGVFVVMSSSGGHGRSLRESHRVLTPSGVLIDVRPVTAAIVLELVIATHAVWAKTICTYSAPEDVAAADAAVQLAVTRGWLAFDMSLPFHSRSIAIAPPSYASMPRRENCAGPRSSGRDRGATARVGRGNTSSPIAIPQAVDAEYSSQDIARPIQRAINLTLVHERQRGGNFKLVLW